MVWKCACVFVKSFDFFFFFFFFFCFVVVVFFLFGGGGGGRGGVSLSHFKAIQTWSNLAWKAMVSCRQWVFCEINSSYNFVFIVLKLCIHLLHGCWYACDFCTNFQLFSYFFACLDLINFTLTVGTWGNHLLQLCTDLFWKFSDIFYILSVKCFKFVFSAHFYLCKFGHFFTWTFSHIVFLFSGTIIGSSDSSSFFCFFFFLFFCFVYIYIYIYIYIYNIYIYIYTYMLRVNHSQCKWLVYLTPFAFFRGFLF